MVQRQWDVEETLERRRPRRASIPGGAPLAAAFGTVGRVGGGGGLGGSDKRRGGAHDVAGGHVVEPLGAQVITEVGHVG